MSKKNKKFKETTITDFYDLKTESIDELVDVLKDENFDPDKNISYNVNDCIGATKGNNTDVKKVADSKKFNPYKLDKLSRVPTWIKAFVIKFWAAGMVCFLFLWGLQNAISDSLLLAFIDGIVMGIVTDLFVNPAMRYFQSDEREFEWYMMLPFPFKKYWTFFVNIIYYTFVNVGVMVLYAVIGNFIYDGIGVEPILYGIFTFLVDMIFIGIKDIFVFLIRKHKQKKEIMENV